MMGQLSSGMQPLQTVLAAMDGPTLHPESNWIRGLKNESMKLEGRFGEEFSEKL